jgi:sterol desaturase/sphingolipid hydroxylase (fatty acid hydroxylase superfamily)
MLDPNGSLLVLLTKNLIAQAMGYFALVGLVFFVVWGWGRERFRAARIPAPERFDAAQLRREIRYTFVTMVVGTSSAGGVIALHARGLSKLSTAPAPAWQIFAWVVALLAFNDLWFYGWHRLLHHPRLFRHVHAVHHKSVDVNPFTSYSFHAFEGFILGLWIVPASVLLPLPMAALAILQVVGLGNNVMAHLGYEFLPRWILRVPLLRLTNTATFHSLHHTRLQGNYGLHSRVWDRLFGTELPEYEEVFLTRGEANPSRPPRG